MGLWIRQCLKCLDGSDRLIFPLTLLEGVFADGDVVLIVVVLHVGYGTAPVVLESFVKYPMASLTRQVSARNPHFGNVGVAADPPI